MPCVPELDDLTVGGLLECKDITGSIRELHVGTPRKPGRLNCAALAVFDFAEVATHRIYIFMILCIIMCIL